MYTYTFLKKILVVSKHVKIKKHRFLFKITYSKSFNSFYLNELRQHHLNVKQQRSSPSPPPTVGGIVIIRDDLPLSRHRWRLGKITELVTGRDNKVRGVKLQTTTESKTTEAENHSI